MRIMRAIYLSDGGKPMPGWHSHACNGGQDPLCKFNRQNTSRFLRWEYEDSASYSCPACKKIAASKQWVAGGAA